MHTLFTLEDRYGLEVCECEDEVHLRVHIHKGRDAAELHRMLSAWGAIAAKLKAGRSPKKNMTAGATATLNLTPPVSGTRSRRRRD